jgi:type IV fimbrial biogenesis protein FimT
MPRGFTVVELLFVMGIVAVLAAIAAPSMRDLITASRVRAASSDFYSALIAARSEAIKRRTNAVIAPNSGTWKTGWTVKVGGNTFQSVDALPGDVGVLPASTATSITYAMNGRVTTGAQTVTFYVPTQTGIRARCVSIDTNGLPRVRTDSNGNASDGCN